MPKQIQLNPIAFVGLYFQVNEKLFTSLPCIFIQHLLYCCYYYSFLFEETADMKKIKKTWNEFLFEFLFY